MPSAPLPTPARTHSKRFAKRGGEDLDLGIFTFLNVAFGVIAIGSGATVLCGMLSGELLNRWAVLFLRCSLTASMTGLFCPSHRLLLTRIVFMLSVSVSGLAILAWRKFHMAGVWRLDLRIEDHRRPVFERCCGYNPHLQNTHPSSAHRMRPVLSLHFISHISSSWRTS